MQQHTYQQTGICKHYELNVRAGVVFRIDNEIKKGEFIDVSELINKLNEIYQKMKSDPELQTALKIKRQEIISDIKDLDSLIAAYLVEKNYDIIKGPQLKYDDIILKMESMDSVKMKENLIKESPYLAVLEGMGKCKNKLDSFLKKYHIGFCRECYLQETGFIHITIGCLLTGSCSFSDSKDTDKKIFKYEMDNLINAGIVVKNNNEYRVIATEKSFHIIEKYLCELNAWAIKMNTYLYRTKKEEDDKTYIRDIDFSVKVDDLFSFEYDVETEKNIILKKLDLIKKDGEYLSQDELAGIKQHLRELSNAVISIEQDNTLTNTCCYILVGSYYNVGEILKISTPVMEKYYSTFKDIRNENRKINEKKKNLGNVITSTEMSSGTIQIKERINKWLAYNLGIYCNKIFVTEYSYKMTLEVIRTNDYFYLMDEGSLTIDKDIDSIIMNKDKMKELFECYGDRDNDDFIMLDNDKNRLQLKSALADKFKSIEIIKYESDFDYKYNAFGIKSINITINNIKDLLID